MSVDYIDQAHSVGSLVPGDHWHAGVPGGTQLGDLLIHQATVTFGINSVDHPNWTYVKNCTGGPNIWVFAKYADAHDVGGWAGELFTARDSGGGIQITDGAYITSCWRNVPIYTDGTVHVDPTTTETNHIVPAISCPTADTEIIVCGGMPFTSGHKTTPLTLTDFTELVYLVASIRETQVLYSKRAGAVGTQGPWTLTTPDTCNMGFVVLGLVPRVLNVGVQLAPIEIPFGNVPAAV